MSHTGNYILKTRDMDLSSQIIRSIKLLRVHIETRYPNITATDTIDKPEEKEKPSIKGDWKE